jgi:hypothetical protein
MNDTTVRTLCAMCGCTAEMHSADKFVVFSEYVTPLPCFDTPLLKCEGFVDSKLDIHNATARNIACAVQAYAGNNKTSAS